MVGKGRGPADYIAPRPLPARCLVHIVRSTSLKYSKIRQFQEHFQFDVCRHEVRYGCLREDSCHFAHSFIELKVWLLQQYSGEGAGVGGRGMRDWLRADGPARGRWQREFRGAGSGGGGCLQEPLSPRHHGGHKGSALRKLPDLKCPGFIPSQALPGEHTGKRERGQSQAAWLVTSRSLPLAEPPFAHL